MDGKIITIFTVVRPKTYAFIQKVTMKQVLDFEKEFEKAKGVKNKENAPSIKEQISFRNIKQLKLRLHCYEQNCST